jgi:hypothetical protein
MRNEKPGPKSNDDAQRAVLLAERGLQFVSRIERHARGKRISQNNLPECVTSTVTTSGEMNGKKRERQYQQADIEPGLHFKADRRCARINERSTAQRDQEKHWNEEPEKGSYRMAGSFEKTLFAKARAVRTPQKVCSAAYSWPSFGNPTRKPTRTGSMADANARFEY